MNMQNIFSKHDKNSQKHGIVKFSETFSHEKLHSDRIYTLALLISILFLTVGIVFILYIHSLNRREMRSYIQVATEQTKFAINAHIKEQFVTMEAAAVMPAGRNLLAKDEFFEHTVKKLTTYNIFVRVGIADKNGQTLWIDRSGIKAADLSNEPFILSALEGKRILTDVKKDVVKGIDANFYAVPIYDNKNGDVIGVLFAAAPESEFKHIIMNSIYAGKGFAHIIDNKGNCIVRSDSPLVVSQTNNIFDLHVPLDPVVEMEIRKNLAMGYAGYLEEQINGSKRLISYTPLGINSWYVLYAVPENMANAGLREVTLSAIAVITIAFAVFVLLIVLIQRANKKDHAILESIAFVDQLTGHANYKKFLLEAEKILSNSNGDKYVVCYSDVKAFKTINDVFGHDTGDRLIKYWAYFLHEITQEGEVFGRVFGDIFVGLMKYQNKQEIYARFESCAYRIAVFPETLSRGYKVELYGGAYLIGESGENLTIRDMLDRAITAQESVKTGNDGQHFCIYTEEMRDLKLWNAELESKMESALENNEFQVYLQPKINIQDGNSIIGAEALVRWFSPEKGLIPPIRFIELFERNGFIIKLDRFIFEEVCKNYKKDILDGGLPPYIISVNVSRLGLMQQDFVRSYSQIKNSYGIPDGCLELEFTESLAFENHVLFQSIINECRYNGFVCSLDDFGAGHSSLNILKSLYVDILKLDGLFFRYGDDAERGRELVKNIISMAKSLNMKTVAEGVDDANQVNQLREMGCDMIQGYVFSKPMPWEKFRSFVETWGSNYREKILTTNG